MDEEFRRQYDSTISSLLPWSAKQISLVRAKGAPSQQMLSGECVIGGRRFNKKDGSIVISNTRLHLRTHEFVRKQLANKEIG